MGNKSIISLGLLVSTLYIYFIVNTFHLTKQSNIVRLPEIDENLPSIESLELLTKSEQKRTNESNKTVNRLRTFKEAHNERISIPAFGFISTYDKYQIVALLSDNDKNRTLSRTIEELCNKSECINDLRYHKDVIDANWQKPISSILTLIATKKIKDGSIFIENNTVKIEGTLYDNSIKKELEVAIQNLYTYKLKVENNTIIIK
jgi:hypothetical protein